MPKYFHTNWKPQFGEPILPPDTTKKKRKPKAKRGSWRRPSEAMLERELSKCKITKIDTNTGEVIDVVEPRSKRKATQYGETGRAPKVPKKR